MQRNQLALLASLAILILVSVRTAVRLHHGVDFMDESLSVAIPYRFALGDRPYIDEVNTIQSAGLIVEPLVRLWLAATGGTDGIVLFLRWVWFGLTCALAGVGVWALRPLVPLPFALLAAATMIAWVPMGSPVLSYNTLASAFFTAGLLFGSAPLLGARSERWFVVAGVCLGLCIISIQSWGLGCVAASIAWLIGSSRGTRVKRALFLASGVSLAILPFLPSLSNFGPAALEFAREHSRRVFPPTDKVLPALRAAWLALASPATALAVASVAFVCACRGWRLASLAAILVAVSLVAPLREHRSSLMHMTYVSGLALVAWPAAGARARRAIWFLWLPAEIGGIVATFTSTNGFVNTGFALLSTVLVAAIVLADLAAASQRPRTGSLIGALSLASLAGWMTFHQRVPFNDDPVATLDARCESGPFRGLWTSTVKREWFERVAADIEKYQQGGRRLLVMYRLPAAYLVTPMRPAANTVYVPRTLGVHETDALPAYRAALDRTDRAEVLVVRLHRLVFGRERYQLAVRGQVDDWLEVRCPQIEARPDWDVRLAEPQ